MGDRSGRGAGVSRWWAVALVVPFAVLVAARRSASGDLSLRLSLAGTPQRWVQAVAGTPASAGDVRIALVLDLVFVVSFACFGLVLTRVGLRWWAPERRRRFGQWRLVPSVCAVAGLLGIVVTAGQLAWFDHAAPPMLVTLLIAALAWWQWVAYGVVAIGLCGLVIGPAIPQMGRCERAASGAPLSTAERDTVARNDDEALGICASGGGIRAAGVMLGAFRGLAADGTFARARWLHAVSGGAYVAGGWRVSSRERGEVDLFAADHPWSVSVRHRRRYLDNGWGSLTGGVVAAVGRTVAVFGGVLVATVVVGWSLGWLVQSWAIHPDFSNLAGGGATSWDDLIEWRLLLPGLIPLVVAALCVVVARTSADLIFRRRLDTAAVAAGLLGSALLFALVAMPIGLRYGRPALEGRVGPSAESNAVLLGFVALVALVVAMRQLLVSDLQRRWSRLGGVALACGLALLAGKVADASANLDGLLARPWVPVAALAWLVLLDLVPSHRLTLNDVYRKRLAGTFCLTPGPAGVAHDAGALLASVPINEEHQWRAYGTAGGPELVLCATSHATQRQLGGLRALGFTFRPEGVMLHDGSSALWTDYPSGSWWHGYPRRWVISRSMALTGAAFASAMGRQSFGTTNSLLAALNLRLGMWVPNPRFAEWFADRNGSPRVHLGYFAKELFNRYHPDRDPFVYVADGGHRDNLGLVEQLRERPAVSIVFDASGDRPGSFTTLRQAIELAGVELGAEVDVDFTRIEPRNDDEPLDCVTTGTVTHPDGATGRIVYAKAQISDTAPVELRQFAAANPPFPNYSTSDQYLTETEYDMLVSFGEHLAARVAALL